MKIVWTGMLLALLAAPGCTWPSFLQPASPPPAPVAAETPRPRGPVTPERVTPGNAYQAADALSEELERAGRENQFK